MPFGRLHSVPGPGSMPLLSVAVSQADLGRCQSVGSLSLVNASLGYRNDMHGVGGDYQVRSIQVLHLVEENALGDANLKGLH